MAYGASPESLGERRPARARLPRCQLQLRRTWLYVACGGERCLLSPPLLHPLPPPADNAPAFQAAIDAAGAAATAASPAAVWIPPGTWQLRQAVSIGSSYVTLRGAGVSAWAGAGDEPQAGCLPAGHQQLQRCLLHMCQAPPWLCRACACRRCPLAAPPAAAACRQVDRTRILVPVGLRAVYGDARAWAFGGAFIG